MTDEKVTWLQMIFQVRGSVIPRILPRILLATGFAVLISVLHQYQFSLSENIFGKVTSNVAYNLVLGLLLVFRTNTAYDRFWEGRKTWGGIVVNSLNLSRKILIGVGETKSQHRLEKVATVKLLGAFAIATKLQLRFSGVNPELKPLLTQTQYSELQQVKNAPLKISYWIGDYLKQQQIENRLSNEELITMNGLLDRMVEALMGCERILKTPIPLAYAIYLRRLLILYCLLLPLNIVSDLELWTGPIVALISFILLGIEEIGNEIENPFGTDPNDLPLDDICNSLVKNIEDLIDEKEEKIEMEVGG